MLLLKNVLGYIFFRKFLSLVLVMFLSNVRVQNLFVTDSLITLYNQNLQYLNAVRSVLNEEISLEDPELTDQSLQEGRRKMVGKWPRRHC